MNKNIRNDEQPIYSRLKTAVRRHVDQAIRTRNFRARTEIVERGTVTTSHKGKKANAERRVGECHQWKAIGQCSVLEETHAVSITSSHLETDAVRNEKNDRLLLPLKRRHRQTGKCPPKVQAAEVKALLGREAENSAKNLLEESVRIRHVICGISRVLQLQVRIRMQVWWQMSFQTPWGWWTAQQRVREKWWKRLSCLIEGVCTIGLCISRFLSEKFYSTWKRKMGIKSHRQILTRHVAPHKKIGKEKVLREATFRSVNLMSAPRAPQVCGRDTRWNLASRNSSPRSGMGLGEKYLQAQECRQIYVLLSNGSQGNAGAHFKISKGKRIRGGLRSISAHAEQKRLELRWNAYSAEIQDLHNGGDGQRRNANKWGSTSIRSRSWSLRDSANTPWHACRPVKRQARRRTQIFLRVAQR